MFPIHNFPLFFFCKDPLSATRQYIYRVIDIAIEVPQNYNVVFLRSILVNIQCIMLNSQELKRIGGKYATYIHIPMHIYKPYAHYLPIICDIWCVCRAKCNLYFVPLYELHFHINMCVAYEYFYIGFSKKAESEHTRTHTHTKEHGNVLCECEVHSALTEWIERCNCERSVRAKRTLCALHFASVKKSCTDISVCVQPFQVNCGHHDAQCIYCRRLR